MRFGPKNCVPFRKNDLDFGGSVSWNTQPQCLEFFKKATEPSPPLFFGFLSGWLSTSLCLNTHFSPNCALKFEHSKGCQKVHDEFVLFPLRWSLHGLWYIFPERLRPLGDFPFQELFPSFCVCGSAAGGVIQRWHSSLFFLSPNQHSCFNSFVSGLKFRARIFWSFCLFSMVFDFR